MTTGLWQKRALAQLEAQRETWTPVEGLVYRGPADFVLEHGRWHNPVLGPRFAPKQCYGNSLFLAGSTPGARYVEGFAIIPQGESLVPHAWVAMGHESFEVTWPARGLAYIGVEFAWERADDATWEGDASVLDDFNRGWPLFRQRWEGEPTGFEWPDNNRVALIRKVRDGQATIEDYLEVLAQLEQEMAAGGS